MSEKKPVPPTVLRATPECPVCGKRSYSQNGIHPQCAMIQADAPRKLRLAAAKAKATKDRASAQARATNSWSRTCPKCGARLTAQQESCGCGSMS